MKTQYYQEFNRTYILGTTAEIAETIAKEMVKRVKKDGNQAIFPDFGFAVVDESLIYEDTRSAAEYAEGWYGCKDIATEFNDNYNRTLIADYYGGGAACAASYWVDCYDDGLVVDAIVDVVLGSLGKDGYHDDSLILIAEVTGDIRSDSAEAARVAKIMECQNDIMEFDDGTYLNIRFNEAARKLEAGNVTNTGLYVTYSIDYDFDDSIYGNLSKLYDTISERKNKN